MKLSKVILAALLAAVIAPRAFAAADPVVTEVKWVQKTVSITTTGVSALTVDPGGFGSYGYNLNGSTYTQNGVDGTTFGQTAIVVSSANPNVIGFDWSALAQGATAQVQIAQTVKVPVPSGRGLRNPFGLIVATSPYTSQNVPDNIFSVPIISTSGPIILPAGIGFSQSFRAEVTNPILYFTGMTPAATYYVTFDYGIPRPQ